jgi:catenin alpha
MEPEMLKATEEVHNAGQDMSAAAKEFANDPCSSAKRGNMVSGWVIRAAR